MIKTQLEYKVNSLCLCADNMEDTLLRIEGILQSANTNLWLINQRLVDGRLMDKQIKNAKKSIDKKMDKLVKEDIKRDKKCEHDEKMAKKKKGKK